MRRTLLVPLLLVSGMLLPGWLLAAAPDSDALLDVLRRGQFTALTHLAELPLPVLRACVNDPNDVAEPGGPFNPTDVHLPQFPAPGTRLVWAATDGEHYVAEFEYGGRGHHSTISMVTFDGSRNTAKVVAVADGEKISGVAELIQAASASKTPFWNEPGPYH